MSQTLLPPSTSLIPTSVSSLQVDRTPSYTYRFTPGTPHHATLLILRHITLEGCGSTMAFCPDLSTTLSSSPPSALLVQMRVAQSLALLSAIMTVQSSFSTLTCWAPRVSMVLPSGSVKQAHCGLMCP